MENYVKQDIQDENLRDEDIFRINEKIKDLEKQILNVIEGQKNRYNRNVISI